MNDGLRCHPLILRKVNERTARRPNPPLDVARIGLSSVVKHEPTRSPHAAFPFPLRSPRLATIPLDPIDGKQCARPPLIPFKSRLSRLSRSRPLRLQACRSPGSSVAAPMEPALASNRHSARRPAGANLPATSCLDAFWTPAGCACGKSWRCRRPKTCTFADLWRAHRRGLRRPRGCRSRLALDVHARGHANRRVVRR